MFQQTFTYAQPQPQQIVLVNGPQSMVWPQATVMQPDQGNWGGFQVAMPGAIQPMPAYVQAPQIVYQSKRNNFVPVSHCNLIQPQQTLAIPGQQQQVLYGPQLTFKSKKQF